KEASDRPVSTSAAGVQVRGVPAKKAPGLAFAQYTKCFLLGKTLNRSPVDIAKQLYKDDERIIALTEKAAVAAANTLNDSWAGALVLDEGGVFADFNDFLLPQTVYGRFGNNGIPSLNQVPFNVPFGAETEGSEGYWVGEGKPKPVTKGAFARDSLAPLKVAAITVATKELLRHSSIAAEIRLRNMLVNGLRKRLDLDFINPAKALVANVSPASILNGATSIASSGNDADAIRCDFQALVEVFTSQQNSLTNAVWIMPTHIALAVSLLRNALGQSEFPGLGMSGGQLLGLPVIVSDYTPFDSDGAIVALVNASDIYVGDEGGFSIDMSTEAALQMDDTPTNASVSGGSNDSVTATSMVSLWQTNSVGFLAEREINWMRNPWRVAAAYLTGVNWGSCGSP
ncbi:MAG TPA: phage major capsid protein, partial [Burkholderiaceae bacterium]|nr:phage major capsid protein [Burkholderiaceae bacterium]